GRERGGRGGGREETEGVERGGGAEPWPDPEAQRADGERKQPKQKRGRKRARAQGVRLAPQGRDVESERRREGRPGRQLERGRSGEHAAPDDERHLAGQEDEREPEKDAGARAVEPAVERLEGRHGQPDHTAHGKLAEEQQEAVPEPRHGARV